MSKPYAHAAPAKTRVLIRQDDDALGGAGGGGAIGGGAAGAAIGSDAPHSRVVIGSDRLPASRGRSPSAGEQLLGTFHSLLATCTLGRCRQEAAKALVTEHVSWHHCELAGCDPAFRSSPSTD